MNELWEEYVYRSLLRSAGAEWRITAQAQKSFWQRENSGYSKKIRPDLVLSKKEEFVDTTTRSNTYVVDTKWKMPDQTGPADADLKQMFVYNEYWKSEWAILLYPGSEQKGTAWMEKGLFHGVDVGQAKHRCALMKVSVLKNDVLDKELGSLILKEIESNCQTHDAEG